MSVVFDLGMNDGADTRHYLARGLTVVAVEANTDLCDRAFQEFEPELNSHRLYLINSAVSSIQGMVPFYKCANDHLSSTDISWASREGYIEEYYIDTITLGDLIHRFGVPTYLKSDIEGADLTVLQQLREGGWKPQYISVEDCRFGFQYFELLKDCGYTKFKLSDQSEVTSGTSGPLGDELPGPWLSLSDILIEYTTKIRTIAGQRIAPRKHWWDIHASY